MNKYEPYNASDLKTLIKEPWEISDNPFMLHAAYALSCLFDICTSDDEEEDNEDFTQKNMWGCTVPQQILDRLVMEIAADFNDAARNHKQIRIWGKSYSIRKVNAYDPKRLHLIFQFPLKDGEYTITEEGVMNLSGTIPDSLKSYEVSCQQAHANRTYLRQIIRLAEDDANNGWDKLTDMEIIVYCWALFYNKYQTDNFLQFKQKYKDYLYVKEPDIISCFNEKASLRQRPVGMYTFSYDKVQEWNETNHQKSVAVQTSPQEADDYWYEKALKSTFKPIDLR